MQQFAIASVSPRSIAWLIRLDEWDHFEKIVKYNCAMQGGYFNVIIPLTDQDTITEEYQSFLVDYDPDLVVLAPDMVPTQLESLAGRLHPFAFIPWESASRIALLDPISSVSGVNVTMISEWIGMLTELEQFTNVFVAVADSSCPDTSRLALIACGDVEAREPFWNVMDEDIDLDSIGYREHFLLKCLKPEYDQNSIAAHVEDNTIFIPEPNRYELKNLISVEDQFPLSGAVPILKACCKLQHFPLSHQSFIGLTANYKKTGGTPQRVRGRSYPAIVILISDSFDLEEATLFWNLRATEVYVAWLSFLDLERNLDPIVQWLESDYGGSYYSMYGGLEIGFSSSKGNITRLEAIVEKLNGEKRKADYPYWKTLPYNDLISYDYIRPYIKQEHVIVSIDEAECTFIPKLPQKDTSGIYAVTLEWKDLMLPQNSSFVRDLKSVESIEYFHSFAYKDRKPFIEYSTTMYHGRITKSHYLRLQISTEKPIEFKIPQPEQIIESLFVTAGFSHIEPSSTAKYHRNFVDRIGGLEKAVHYLSSPPYRELLEVLSDNKDREKLGWILSNPSPRRTLHHLHLRELLGTATPTDTKKYFDTVSDELPEEAISLLEEGILERGFRLKCHSCSFNSWYPAEHVGQVFECSRCFQSQVYKSNPLWLYKLREVIFQGFDHDMQVPLLALNHLKRKSLHYFEWVPDSDVYWSESNEEMHQNVDVLCICDGKLFIGEAKSNDEIDVEQFSFYEKICKLVAVDGIVFATSKPQWGRGVLQRVEQLKSWFEGEVLVLTETNLYQNTSINHELK